MIILLRRHKCSGFTLLEVLVALFIAAISVGALGMALSSLYGTSQVEQQANSFDIWFERARQHSLVRNVTYRIDYDSELNTMLLLEFDEETWQQANVDKPRLMNRDNITIRDEDEDDRLPVSINIFPDNTYSEFIFHYSLNDDTFVSVSGDGYASLSIENPRQD